MSCCHEEKKEPESCHGDGKKRQDHLLNVTAAIIALSLAFHFLPFDAPYISEFSHAITSLLKTMWWGIAIGLLAIGIMQKIPREYFTYLLGPTDTVSGIFRAALAGIVLDLCSHGILMVGAKLYERGASLAQVMAFLIASPWNSLTLTLILISLVGLKITLAFIVASALIAIITGLLFNMFIKAGILEDNPHHAPLPVDFDIKADIKERLKHFKADKAFFYDITVGSWSDGKMVIRWLFFGTIMAGLIRVFVSTDIMTTYFGPTIIGLLLTLLATTIIEVCSEGSTPVGAELINRAGAPGNGFVFLMAGVSTDYTEMLVLRQVLGRWKPVFFLPLLTVPQILVIGWAMNNL